MTNLQKQQIRSLRMEGVGYKSIATKVGLSRDAVRQYCKRNGLDGLAESTKIDMQMQNKDKCKYCNAKLTQKPKTKTRIFCSTECRNKWWTENAALKTQHQDALYKFICKNCGCEFTAYGNSKRKFCNHQCYIKFYHYKEACTND